ncbi:MAG: Fe-S cluster assembly protein HesB [Blastocatellia bacterium]|nr:Fe-S cluster assembly protein HesB [Blastocatellia bacterium]
MPKFSIPKPADFSFRHTVNSHGWYDLRPFEFDADNGVLGCVFRLSGNEQPIYATIRERGDTVEIKTDAAVVDAARLKASVRHLLRLDDNIGEFYEAASKIGKVTWAADCFAGRLLRSATVYEDLIKTVCTTNCTWSVTRGMTTKLVEQLGDETACGRRAFPTAETMAGMPADFYRETIRAGYRSEYLVEIAVSVAEGRLDPESWLTSDLPTVELKKEMKRVKGVGDYAADNLLKLVGRYDGLALDSWLRAGFYKKHNRGKKCPDKKIERHYAKFGAWQGLAIWCDMTEDWFA